MNATVLNLAEIAQNLIVALAVSTLALNPALFYLHNKYLNRRNPMRDLKSEVETEFFAKQN